MHIKSRPWKIGDAVRCTAMAPDNYAGLQGVIAAWGWNNTIEVRFPKDDDYAFFDDDIEPAPGLFRLTALWQSDGPSVGRRLRRAAMGCFPDAAIAGLFLDAVKPAGRWPYLFYYLLEPAPAHRQEYSYPMTVFDRNGILRGAYDDNETGRFLGREEKDCRFKRGDVVQFGETKLMIGVLDSLPPDAAFIATIKGADGRLDACDDSYLVRCGKGGKDHVHLHECCLFPPDVDIPPAITALREAVLTGRWRPVGS